MATPDRRTLLIEAASELFTEQAYDEVTTARIARRAGVAYGLIAHHFTNKRGLYLATIHAAADRLAVLHDTPPEGATPRARLRHSVARHIAFMEEHSAGFLAVLHAGNGSDAQVRAIVEDLRWQGAGRLLRALGVDEPVPPVLRTALRGWVGLLDEMIVDRIRHDDVPADRVAELAVAALESLLRTTGALPPHALALLDEH